MATVNKNFKIKSGLVVEGTTGTINGEDILTTSAASTQHIIDIVGGETLITSVESTQLEVVSGELNVKSGVFDAAGAAAAAQTAAESYADGLASNYDAAGAAAAAQTAANSYTDGEITTALTTAQGYANTAESNAEAYADGLAVNYDAAGAAAAAQTAAESFATTAANNAQSAAEDYADGLAGNYEASGAVSTHSGLTTGVHGVSGDVVGTSDVQTLTNKTMGDDLLMGGFQVSGLGTPTQSDHAATKAYVDAVAEGLHVHEAARVAINGNISIATGLENGDTAGGVTLVTGDRVLVKDQTTASENGIYVVQASGQALRATDFDTATEIDSGDFVFVTAGTYANTGWVQTLKPATIGTDALSFSQFSGAGTFLAGNGLVLDGNTFEIDDTITATRTFASDEASAAETAANTYTDGEITTALTTAQGYANTAESNAEAYADGLASNYDPAGSASSAQTAAQSYADGLAVNYDAAGSAAAAESDANSYTDTAIGNLDTDDIEEGTSNLYYTDARAKAEAAALLTNATKTNITITADGSNNLTITAENGVADSDTDDLTEGSSNLYFTEERAVTAISNATQISPQAIDITWVRREEATWTDANVASKVTCHSTGTENGSMKYLVRVVAQVGGVRHSQVTEVLATVDGANNVAVVEYGTIYTSENPLATATVEWNSGTSKYDLNVTTANANSEVMVAATLIATID